MAYLINAQGISKNYGPRSLFEDVSLTIHPGDRIAFVGPNGAGKTTLLRILADEEESDSGSVIKARMLRIAHVPQENDFDPKATVHEIVSAASVVHINNFVEDDHEREVRINKVIAQMGFDDPRQRSGVLSGGWQKRLAIAAALARDPAVLMLDEPTNHLDLQGILWLEKFLKSSRLAYVVISHDRTFLQEIATTILEVSPRYPGGVFEVKGTYSDFLEKRGDYLKRRAQYQDSLRNRVRRELEWLSRGPKARTTKAQSRIDEAHRLQNDLAKLISQEAGPSAGIEMTGSGRKTKRLLVAKDISKDLGGKEIFSNLDLILQPRQRLGVVGANGCGKSTLLRLLAGELETDSGWIKRAEHLKIVYFDQNREKLEPHHSLRKALAGSSDSVIYRDRAVHVVTWAKRFQFSVEQLDLPLSDLSGGEHARVCIARLMLRPADLLLLDEPTNDLDIPTLEVLEESLLDFPGCVVLVTHDRLMLDRVSTLLLGLNGGKATYYADTSQWLESIKTPVKSRKTATKAPPKPKKKSLTYLEKREYEGIEAVILEAEAVLEKAQQDLEDPIIASDAERAHEAFEAEKNASTRVDELYARWSELEGKLASLRNS